MTIKDIIDFIYAKIADKSLTPGCKVSVKKGVNEFEATICRVQKKGKDWRGVEYGTAPIIGHKYYFINTSFNVDNFFERDIKEVIGHPVMIGDVLNYIENNLHSQKIRIMRDLFDLWADKRKPIEVQSDDCINYIYNLINK